MSSNDDRHSGIPTRAIHEAYLDMQRALAQYRRAQDRGDDAAMAQHHGNLQSTVLTFYELLRPHIRSNDAVSEYWEGELPSYNGDGTPPDPEDGTAVLQVQTHRDSAKLNGADPGDMDTLEDWHDALELNGNARLAAVSVGDGVVVAQVQYYELGLSKLDGWRTRQVQRRESIGGYLGGQTRETRERQRVAIGKLRRAARELSDVAEQLGALSEFDASTPRTEITDELIEEVDEWRKQQIE